MALTINDREKTRIKADNILSDLKIAGAYDQYKPDKWDKKYRDKLYEQYKNRQNPKDPGDPETIQMELPLDLVQQLMIRAPDLVAGLMDDLTISGGNKNAAKNLKILKGADRGVPNADRFVEKKGLGAILPNLDQASLSPEALNALRKGTKKGLSSREIRDLIKPFTKPDQFGHPSGKLI